MTSTPDSGAGSLAQRLEHLFATAYPPSRGPYTTKEAVAAMNEAAGRQVISYNYLYQLRRGTRTEPGHARLAAIARFFGVPVTYFDNDPDDAGATLTRPENQEIITALRDTAIRDLAVRAAGLSPGSLDTILTVIDNARRLEGLPPVREDNPAEL